MVLNYILRHFRAVAALPFNVCVMIPAALVYFGGKSEPFSFSFLFLVAGYCFTAIGIFLLAITNLLFFQYGNGTLAPFDPPSKFVVKGIYLYWRNPMITGVFFILFGEFLIFNSWYICYFFLFFVAAQNIFIIFFEEPELKERFGKDYITYEEHVPRWIPRIVAWNPNSKKNM